MTKKAAVEKAEKDRAQRSTMKYPSPPPRKKSIVANPCEVLALKVIVGHLFIDLAHLNEKLNGTPLQAFGNAFSVRCQEVLLSAKIVAPDGLDVEALRRDAINHVNKILAVKFAGGRAKTN